MNFQPVCIYHKDCSDGTAAAAVFLRRFPEGKTFPFTHGYTKEDAEDFFSVLKPDTIVYTLDCTILVKECLEKGNTVISLDHHAGIYEEMSTFAKTQPNYTYIFNNDLSGATVTWKYFFPDEKIPRWLELVQDTDLWTNKFEESKYFVNWFYMQTNNPQALLFLFEKEDALKECLQKGSFLEDLNQFYIKSFKEKSKPLFLTYKDYDIPAYNSTFLQSVLANVLVDSILGVAIIFSVKGDKVRMSVRSTRDSQVSALEVAQKFGGGGHRNAAGCEVDFNTFTQLISDKK